MTLLKQCCASGSLHTGLASGRVETVHGLNCYIADSPAQTKGIVVIVSDAFGWQFPNNRILADRYAKAAGVQVLLPDFMNGASMSPQFLISTAALSATGFWNQIAKIGHALRLLRHTIPFMFWTRHSVTKPRVYQFVKDLKDGEASGRPVAAAGFCWGAPFVTELCWDRMKSASGARLIECGFVAHPSHLHIPVDIENVTIPFAVAAAERDIVLPLRHAEQVRRVLEAKTAKTKDDGIVHDFIMYSGVGHGFAVRSDETQTHEATQAKRAREQAVKWFSRWFEKLPPITSSCI